MIKNAFAHILLCMLGEMIKKMFFVLLSNKKTFMYPQKWKIQTQKESNTLMMLFYKHHGQKRISTYFQRGIAHVRNYYSMLVQYFY